jgi:hypothetical protein
MGISIQKLSQQLSQLIIDLHFEQGMSFEDLYRQKEKYVDFFDLLCVCSKKVLPSQINDLSKVDLLKKYFLKKCANIAHNDSKANQIYKLQIDDIKLRRQMGENFSVRPNEVVIEESVTENYVDKCGKSIEIKKTSSIKQMNVRRIQFASPITVDAMKIANETQKMTNEMFQDLVIKLKGGTPKKHKFNYLDLAKNIKEKAREILADFDNVMDMSEQEMYSLKNKIELIKDFSRVADIVKKNELAPIYLANTIHESGLNRQREVQAAISNDRMQIDFGNIELEREEKIVSDAERIRTKLLEKGYQELDVLMNQVILNAGGSRIEDDDETLDSEEEDVS